MRFGIETDVGVAYPAGRVHKSIMALFYRGIKTVQNEELFFELIKIVRRR